MRACVRACVVGAHHQTGNRRKKKNISAQPLFVVGSFDVGDIFAVPFCCCIDQALGLRSLLHMAHALGLPVSRDGAVAVLVRNSRAAYARLAPQRRLPARLVPVEAAVVADDAEQSREESHPPWPSMMTAAATTTTTPGSPAAVVSAAVQVHECATEWTRALLEPGLWAQFDEAARVTGPTATGVIDCAGWWRRDRAFPRLEACCRQLGKHWVNGACRNASTGSAGALCPPYAGVQCLRNC